MQHKRGIIIGQFDRIMFLSHPKYHKKNIESMINVLLINGYLLNIIFSTIRDLKNWRVERIYDNNIDNDDSFDHDRKKFFSIPYI